MGRDPADVKRDIEQTRAELTEDIEALREQVAAQGGVKGIAKDEASKAADSARSAAEREARKKLASVEEQARQAVAVAGDEAKKELSSAAEQVRQQPAKALAPLAGVALLVAAVLKRRRAKAKRRKR